MDTDFDINWERCIKCYECVKLCTNTYKPRRLGYLYIDEDGYPEYDGENCHCHLCDAVIDGKKMERCEYGCKHVCPTGAINITRW